MTAPTDRLAQLSIAGGMSSRSRKEAQQERRRREAEQKRRQQEQQDPQPSTSTYLPPISEPSLIESATGLRYHIHGLPDPIRATARRGLTADNISIERAKIHTPTANDSYLVIQVVERLRLSVHTFPRNGRMIGCSCAEFATSRPNICSHIYWLYDRINKLQQNTDSSPPRALNLHNVEATLTEISSYSDATINNLPEEISPLWTELDDEVDHEVEDILGVLDPRKTSGDYDEDFYNSLPLSNDRRFYDLVVPGDLFRTIFTLARHDRILRERLSVAITREAIDKDLLRKLSKRRKSCFEQLSKYEKEGPELRTNQVARICWIIREIIDKLSEYRQRVYENPNPAFDKACAKAAIKLLRTICDWNRDIYANATWLQDRPWPTSSKDRNLYLSITASTSQDSGSNFLVHFLAVVLPNSASMPYIQDLKDITARLATFSAPNPLLEPLLSHLQNLRSTPASALTELDNYQSLSISSPRSSRTGSSSSGSSSSYASIRGHQHTATLSKNTRRPSETALEGTPEPQRRRLG